MNEGEGLSVAIGALPDATIAADGLEAQLEGDVLRVRAPYGASGRKVVTVTATDTIVTQPIEVVASAWKPTVTWTDGPEAREHGAVLVDKDNKRVILIGGSGYMPYGTPLADVWAYSLVDRKWSRPAIEGDVPTPAGSRRVAGRYLFGGYGEGQATNNELIRVELGNPIRFKRLTTTIPPRALHAFVEAPDGFIVFGGMSTKPLNDVWHLRIDGDSTTALKLAPTTTPTARYGFFYGADEARLVVFSGAQSFSTVKPAEDTWSFDFASRDWTQIAVGDPHQPKGRRNGCFVSDPASHRLFVLGGTADAMTTEPGFYVLTGQTWSRVDRPGEPPLRSSGFGFFFEGAATCGFGNTTKAVYADWSAFGPT